MKLENFDELKINSSKIIDFLKSVDFSKLNLSQNSKKLTIPICYDFEIDLDDMSKKLNYDCNVVLTNDKLLKKMNNKYRNKNRATDVLTFVSEAKIGKNNRMKVCDIFFFC